jgi:hypothetical protein
MERTGIMSVNGLAIVSGQLNKKQSRASQYYSNWEIWLCHLIVLRSWTSYLIVGNPSLLFQKRMVSHTSFAY